MNEAAPPPSESPKAGVTKIERDKRRELSELRLRWKISDETIKKFTDERKILKTRIDALATELGRVKPAAIEGRTKK